MTAPGHAEDTSYATYREVANLLEKHRTELVAEIKLLSSDVNTKLTVHEVEHVDHERRHDRERDWRAGLTRWAVTSVLTGCGVIAAILIALFAK